MAVSARRRSPAAVLLFAIGLGCGPDLPNLDSPGTTVVCLGDSLTAGVGSDGGPTYPEALAAMLDVAVINAGSPGDTVADGLARLDGVLTHDPWLVIVELGGNDLLRQVPVERTEAAYRELVDRLLAARVAVILIEVRGPFGGRLRGLFRRLEDDYGVPVIAGALPELLADRRFKSDPIHLNGEGYRRLASAVAEEVRPLLAARRERGLAPAAR